jgi:hypothetical protein
MEKTIKKTKTDTFKVKGSGTYFELIKTEKETEISKRIYINANTNFEAFVIECKQYIK